MNPRQWLRVSSASGSPDEYSRECLAIDVKRAIDADGGSAVSNVWRPTVGHRPTCAVFFDPSSRWQNGWIESINGRLRDEYLNSQRFNSPLEAKVLLEDWRIAYNINRPQQRARLDHPGRVRRGVAPPTTAHTRVAGGSTIGFPLTIVVAVGTGFGDPRYRAALLVLLAAGEIDNFWGEPRRFLAGQRRAMGGD